MKLALFLLALTIFEFITPNGFALDNSIHEGEACRFVLIKDGKSFSVPLEYHPLGDDAVYTAEGDGFSASIKHNWGNDSSAHAYPDLFAEVRGPWKHKQIGIAEQDGYMAIYPSDALDGRLLGTQDEPTEDLPTNLDKTKAMQLSQHWEQLIHSSTFVTSSNDQKERRIFDFLAKEFPNGALAEDIDPSNENNRAFISCQEFF